MTAEVLSGRSVLSRSQSPISRSKVLSRELSTWNRPAAVVGGDGPGGLAVAEALGRHDLPGADPRLLRVGKGVEPVEDLPLLARGRDGGAHPRGFPVLAVDRDQDVLHVRLLAADGVDADGPGDVADEAKPGPGLDRLLLPGVAGEDHLGVGGPCHAQDLPGLERGKLAGLVDHDDGAGADRDPAVGDAGVELVDAPAGRVEIGAEFQRDAPRHRGGDNVVALRPVEVGDGPQRRRLPAPGRALDDRDLARPGGGPHGGDLLVVDRIVGRPERAHPGRRRSLRRSRSARTGRVPRRSRGWRARSRWCARR